MTLIEGIGDEVIQFFIALFFILLVAFAWCTTNIANDGTLRTVFLLERRQQIRAARRLSNLRESSTITEGAAVEESVTEQAATTSDMDKPSETESGCNSSSQSSPLEEEERIVEAMDAPRDTADSILRRRRLDFFNRASGVPIVDEKSSNSSETTDTPIVQNDLNNESVLNEESDNICVKLMYLNDEVKQVDGRLQEKLGEFKRRHFEIELQSNKVVKLIFNGHVLQQDSNTLQSCGLFDNCVVHCLVHQRSFQGGNSGNRDNNSSTNAAPTSNAQNNHQPYEWHLENYLFFILCCFLGAAWYLRYVYAHLYTVTATIGLILMTGIFSIIMFGMHFPDNALNQQTQNTQSRL